MLDVRRAAGPAPQILDQARHQADLQRQAQEQLDSCRDIQAGINKFARGMSDDEFRKRVVTMHDAAYTKPAERVETVVETVGVLTGHACALHKDDAEALHIANDTLYGLGAGVWSRNGNVAYRMGRAIKAGRVWTNCYHAYPAHAAFGGYKESGIGRETHKMMLDHYQQTKNLLVSYSESKLGFF